MGEAGDLRGRRVLVIEDDLLVAQTLCFLLEEAGADILGPIGWLDEALAFLAGDEAAVDVVVLDLNLHGTASYPIADALGLRGIPFVFLSGYDTDAVAPAYRGHRRCAKPVRLEALVAALAP